jgi:AraC-like DNA-binding protein
VARPMTVRRWAPCAELRPFVEAYSIREAGLGRMQAYVPLPARRDCFLEFYLQDRYRIVTVATGAEHWAPRCVLVGPSTKRTTDLRLSGSLRVFSVRFSPVGFRALFGIPARLLRDQAMEAEHVLGPAIAELHEQLALTAPMHWESITEGYLLKRARALEITEELRIAARAAAKMQQSRGRVNVAAAAAASSVGTRRLERAFQEQIGVSPKVFARLLRLDHALEIAGPTSNWADVAILCGYFDQSHMVRDFRALTGATSVEFAALRAAPPRC